MIKICSLMTWCKTLIIKIKKKCYELKRFFIPIWKNRKIFFVKFKVFFILIIAFILPFLPLPIINLPFFQISFNSNNFLITIIQSLAQLLGIIGAFILITFQFQRKSFSKLAFLELINFGLLWEVFMLYIGTIIFCILALLFQSNPANFLGLKFTYMAIFLFTICILFLWPLIKSVLENSKAKTQAKKYINKINSNSISVFQHYDRATLQKDYLSILEKNPIVILTDGAISLLVDGDMVGLIQVIIDVNDYLIKYLKNNDIDRRTTLIAFLYFYRNLANQALELKNERILTTIIDCFDNIYYVAAEEKFLWHELSELNKQLSEIILKGIQFSLGRFVELSLYKVQWIQEYNLEKNIPKPSEIWDMYGGELKIEDKKGSDNELQWTNMSEDYSRMIFLFADEAIKYNRPEIWANCLRIITGMGSDVIKLTNINDNMKSRILGSLYFWAKKYTNKGIDEGLWKYTSIPFPFSEFTISEVLENGKDYGKEMLLVYSEALYDLANKNVLNNYDLNNYVAMGRGFTTKLKGNPLLIDSFIVIITTLDKIREVIQKRKNTGELVIYAELFEQVKSLDSWLKTNYPNRSLRKKVNNVINLFDNQKVKNNMSKRHFIDWPSKSKAVVKI